MLKVNRTAGVTLRFYLKRFEAFAPTQDSLEAEVLSDIVKELPRYINYTKA